MIDAEFTDRYDALGITPCPWTICKGPCEGIGVHPMRFEEWEQSSLPLCPQRGEDGRWEPFPPSDGCVFVYCSECGGTGRRREGRLGRALEYLHTFYYPFRMFAFAVGPAGRGFWEPHGIRFWLPHAARVFRYTWKEGAAGRRAK